LQKKASLQWDRIFPSVTPFFLFCLLGLMACGEKLRYDSHIDFPIVTHYPKRYGTKPDKLRKDPPGWGNFSASITDHTAPSRNHVLNAIKRLEEEGDCPVDIYNHIDSLRSSVARLQVVNNVMIGQSLWTFFVGPRWKKKGGSTILVVSGRSGTASNNSATYGDGGGLNLPEAVAKAGRMGNPFVLAFVNSGGRESQGNHPDIIRSVGEGIAFAKQHLGIDDQRVIFAGQSRGAAAALIWGANPHQFGYKTAGIFASAPPINYATLSDEANGTFPMLASLVAAEFSPNRKSNRVAGDEHNRTMHILRDCMAGSQNPDTLKSRSPIAQIDRYKNVYLALGWRTHDPLVGPREGFEFVKALDKDDIPYFAEFTLGRAGDNSQGIKKALWQFLQKAFGETSEELPLGRTWNRWLGGKGKRHFQIIDEGSPIWTVFPKITTGSRDHAIYVGGPDGSEVYLMAKRVGGDPVVWHEADVTIEWDYVRIDLPSPPQPGRYKWTIVVGNAEIPDEAVLTDGENEPSALPETLVLEKERDIGQVFDPYEKTSTFGHAWVWPY
jgi:hypothetical protein